MGRRHCEGPAELLSRAGAGVPRRVRQDAEQRQSHPFGVARLQRRFWPRSSERALRLQPSGGEVVPEPWLEQVGLEWLRAIEEEDGFAEAVIGGAAVRGPRTGVTQSRLGYCWSHLAILFPEQKEFARAAEKSFRLPPLDSGTRVYDHSFFLLFMAWYFRLTGDRGVIERLRERYSAITAFLGDAGAGGFGEQKPGIRSHNP